MWILKFIHPKKHTVVAKPMDSEKAKMLSIKRNQLAKSRKALISPMKRDAFRLVDLVENSKKCFDWGKLRIEHAELDRASSSPFTTAQMDFSLSHYVAGIFRPVLISGVSCMQADVHPECPHGPPFPLVLLLVRVHTKALS